MVVMMNSYTKLSIVIQIQCNTNTPQICKTALLFIFNTKKNIEKSRMKVAENIIVKRKLFSKDKRALRTEEVTRHQD